MSRQLKPILEVEFWESTTEELLRGNRVEAPIEVIPYWKPVIRPTVDKRLIRWYREWPQ